ncbi:MAG: cupredoxin domain-containing protein [Myxococcales bacterium]|nr:cupredoxin domain-containing protein [Myxococcales bacterium]
MKRWALGCGVLVGLLACKQAASRPTQSVTVAAGARVPVTVGEGYSPETIRAPAGAALTLVFTRNTDESCGQTLVFPSLNLRRELPLNQPVEVAVTVPATGALNFTCGMNMYRGAVTVQ